MADSYQGKTSILYSLQKFHRNYIQKKINHTDIGELTNDKYQSSKKLWFFQVLTKKGMGTQHSESSGKRILC
jgi:hypothetical protein